MLDPFQHRVATERRIITTINASNKFPAELSGLTSAAIENWRSSISKSPNPALDQITDILLSLALATHSIVNVSDEIFEEFEPAVIDHQILILSSMVDELTFPSGKS